MSATVIDQPSGQTLLRCYNPATGKQLGDLEAHDSQAVEGVLKRLHQAAREYNYSPVAERVKLLSAR